MDSRKSPELWSHDSASFEFNVSASCNKKTDSMLIRQCTLAAGRVPRNRKGVPENLYGFEAPRSGAPRAEGPARWGPCALPCDTYPGQAIIWGSSMSSPAQSRWSGVALGESTRDFSLGTPQGSEHRGAPSFGASRRRPFTVAEPTHTGRFAFRPPTRNPILGELGMSGGADRDWTTTHRNHFDASRARAGRPATLHKPNELSPESSIPDWFKLRRRNDEVETFERSPDIRYEGWPRSRAL